MARVNGTAMVDDTNEPESVASLMEALWGPRANVPEDDPAGSRENAGQAPADAATEPAPASTIPDAGAVPPAGSAFDGFKAYLDAAFAGQLASLRSYVDAALAAGLKQVRSEALAAVDAQVSGALADQLATVRAEAAAGADARIAGAEARLDSIEPLEKSTAERLEGLEQLARPALQRLAGAVEDLQQASMTASDLAALRSEVLEAAESRVARSDHELKEQLDALTVSVDGANTVAATAARARLDAMEEHLNLELVRVSESVAGIRAELADSVAELETALGRWAAEWRADVDARLAGVVGEIGPAPADPGRRLRRKKVRWAEMERLVESVAAWRAQSVGPEELVALRRELEAEVERRFAVLDAVPDADRGTGPQPG